MTSLREESPASRPTGADIGDFSLAYSRSLLCCCGFQACAYTARRTWVSCGMVYIPLQQQSSTFSSPRTGFMEDSFSMDRGGGGWFWDDSSTVRFVLLRESNATADMTGGRTQTVMQVMESRCKYRWNFMYSPPVLQPGSILVHGTGVEDSCFRGWHTYPDKGWPSRVGGPDGVCLAIMG